MDSKNKSIGVRELRNNLSVYLDKVKQGESLDVTEWGQTIARVVPLNEGASRWDTLVSEGSVRTATGKLTDVEPLSDSGGSSISEILEDVRSDRL